MSNEFWNLLPVLMALAVVVIVIWLAIALRREKPEYDERQELLRGRAFRRAFLAVCALMMVHVFLVNVLDRPLMRDGVASVLALLLGCGWFSVDCVVHDAFFPLRQRPGVYLFFNGVIVLTNGIGGVKQLAEGQCVEDGLLTMSITQLVMAAVFLAILMALVWRLWLRREGVDE